MATIGALIGGAFALLFGGVVVIMLSGFGICGSELSIGASAVGILFAIVASLIGFVTTPSKRAIGASLFSLPVGLMMILSAFGHEWLRCLSMCACIVASGLTVWALSKGLGGNRMVGSDGGGRSAK